MSKISKIATSIIIVLFCCFSVMAMENIFEKSNNPHYRRGRAIHDKLVKITNILEKDLGTINSVINPVAGGDPRNLCNLSVLNSGLMSGKVNKPLRDDLHSLTKQQLFCKFLTLSKKIVCHAIFFA